MGETNWRTDNTTQREMTLDEWCATLPEGHRARLELTRLRTALAEVERENAQWRTWGIVEVAIRNPSVADYMNHWEARAEKAETALAAAERAGAERAAKEAWRLVKIHPKGWSDEDAEWLYVNAILRALFPPPGAEVGRG